MTTFIKEKTEKVEQTNINNSRVLKLKAEYKRTSLNKIVFFAKLCKYRILFDEDKLTF